ncbi:hypothetical protein [Colwellia sp. MB02u-9]|uniref:hypothetical protein n=1 Tax=Colwellia sp. MB02u-9 TaxID=2759823 RepID=UPI0015F6A212|nr:hypothetical protein [Colwellia sp. MB02u-9]MBA6296596.1 hypothetical protein [Colwellia sp. MB02u-9]
MSGKYSSKQFMKVVSNVFLNKYFEHENIDLDVDSDPLREHDTDLLINAILLLKDIARSNIESDFQQIHSLATRAGIKALTAVAKKHDNIDFNEKIRSINGIHNQAMWAFINNREYWQDASILFEASSIQSSTSPKDEPLTIIIKLTQLPGDELMYFDLDLIKSKSEGKSSVPNTCKVEQRKENTLKTYRAIQKAAINLKKQHPSKSKSWIAQSIAKMPVAQGKSSETIRKNINI